MNEKWTIDLQRPADAKLSLLCIPYAGASAGMFSSWQKAMDDVAVYPMLLPFRDARRNEPMPDSVDALADAFVRDNEDFLSGDYAVFGHCTGAVLGYAIAAAAQKRYGKAPRILIVSSSAEPGVIPADARELSGAADEKITEYLRRDSLVDEAILEMPEFVEYYYPILRADFALYAGSSPACEKLMCPVTALFDVNDKKISSDDVLRWGSLTDSFSTIQVDGGHFSIIRNEDNVISIVKNILRNS